MGAHLDLAVYNISQALKENGLWEDTIFIFVNDNGDLHAVESINSFSSRLPTK